MSEIQGKQSLTFGN